MLFSVWRRGTRTAYESLRTEINRTGARSISTEPNFAERHHCALWRKSANSLARRYATLPRTEIPAIRRCRTDTRTYAIPFDDRHARRGAPAPALGDADHPAADDRNVLLHAYRDHDRSGTYSRIPFKMSRPGTSRPDRLEVASE
jgi:hypothetical protein